MRLLAVTVLEELIFASLKYIYFKMKVTSVLATLFSIASATPTPTVDHDSDKALLAKRASVSEVATLGFATLNGGYDKSTLLSCY